MRNGLGVITDGHRQMRYRLAGFRDDHLRDQTAVAGGVVALEAQQAGSTFARERLRLRQFRLRPVGRHMVAENNLHALRMAGTDGIPARFRRAQALQMNIGNAGFVQRGG